VTASPSSQQPPSGGGTPQSQRQVLGRAAQRLASAQDFRDTLRQTIDACLPALGDFGFFAVLHEGGVIRTVAAHEAPAIEALLAPTQWVRSERTDINLCGLSSGEPALHADTDDAWYQQIARNEGHLALLRRLAFTSMVTVPMRFRGEMVGGLTLFMGRSGRRHTAADLDFALEISALAAPLVANARLLEQRLEAEAALRQSEERLRMAVEAGEVGIWDWDMSTNRVTWSDRVYRMHELEPGSDTGGFDGFKARIHPDDREQVLGAMSVALAGGPAYAVEFRTVLADGRIRWIATRGTLVRDAGGRPLRMVGASTDVTPRLELLAAERRARDDAESARGRMELLAHAGGVMAGSLDPQDTLRAIARTLVPVIADWCRIDLLDEEGALQRRLAYHRDPALAQKALELALRMRASPDTVGSMTSVLASGRPYYGRADEPGALADPALRSFIQTFGLQAQFIVPLTARNRTIGVLAVMQAESGRDLGEDDRALVQELAHRAALALDNARLYAEAEAARHQAEMANRTKDEFLAMLGHELRNPLAPIVSALELMQRRDGTVHAEERRLIGRQVAHLSRLIDDLLDISRITQGKIELRREAVDLNAVIASAIELTRPVFDKHQRQVDVRLPRQAAVVSGDAVRLTQVVCNLLVNAAKFTPLDGQVVLEMEVKGAVAELAVADTGRGISSELLPCVFDLFVQGQQSIDRRSGGLGLGLAIVKSLVEMHGGTVQAQSDGVGCGSRFSVCLPLVEETPAPVSRPAGLQADGTGQAVLVVDDNTDAAESLADLLRMVGYDVRTAGNAGEALALLSEFAPELGLLDIGLPEIDGYQLAALLRDDPRGKRMQLVALTGYGRDNDRARALAAGFDEHLVKPVAIDRLLQVVGELLHPTHNGVT
jgi:PAS domain S-box-containing protein